MQKFCILNILKICKNFAFKCIEQNKTKIFLDPDSLEMVHLSNEECPTLAQTSTWNRMINLLVSQTNRAKFKALDIIRVLEEYEYLHYRLFISVGLP